MKRWPVNSPRARAARKARKAQQAALQTRIADVLTKSRPSIPPTPSALVLVEGKMPGARVVEGYGNVFNLPDYQGDIVVPGAFDAWLAQYDGAKAPIPFLQDHQQDDPDAVLGWATDVKVDDHGLWARFALLAEKGEDVFRRVRRGVISGLSIGYEIKDFRAPTWPERELGAKRVLTEVHVREISLVREPANTASRVYSVKSRAQVLVDGVREQLAVQRPTPAGALDAEAARALSLRIAHLLARAR